MPKGHRPRIRLRLRPKNSRSASTTTSEPPPYGPTPSITWPEALLKIPTALLHLTTKDSHTLPALPTTLALPLMSRFFPHTPYADDQPRAHALLAFHALHRGYTLGALTGLFATPLIHYSARLLPPASPLRTRLTLPFNTLLLRSAGVGSLAGIALLAVGLQQRMAGREEIEWQDRAWRLRENRGQMEVDDFALLGTLVGGVLARGGRVGGAAVGNLAGVVGCLGWRYGVKGGKWEEEERGF